MKILSLEGFECSFNSIRLQWSTQGDLSPAFKENVLNIRFDGDVQVNCNAAAFIFFNVIVPCYHFANPEGFIVRSNFSASAEMINTLLAYHEIWNVTSEVLDGGAVSVDHIPEGDEEYGLFYGGGKDSLLAAALHERIYGARKTTLLRLVWDVEAENLLRKREIFESSMGFMSRKGFQFEFIESDFHVNIITREVGKVPNVGLYPGLMLPIISAKKISQLSYGYDASEFQQPNREGGRFRFNKVRPERIRLLSDAISIALGRRMSFKNFNYGINPGVALKCLAGSFPEYLPNIYMCERLGQKWCIKCRKCFLYAISCLAFGVKSDFNLAYFFQNSVYVAGLLQDLKEASGEKIASNKNPVYLDRFSYRMHLCSTIDILQSISIDAARQVLGHPAYPNAFSNFKEIYDFYSGYSFPEHGKFWLKAYQEDARILGNDPDRSIELEMMTVMNESEILCSSKDEFSGLNRDIPVGYRFQGWN